MKKQPTSISRRKLIRDSSLLGIGTAWTDVPEEWSPERKEGKIIAENKKPGTTDWQLTYLKSDNFRSEAIEGYCSHTSIRAGEKLEIFLSAKPATAVTVDIYRMGYYGGKGGRHMTRLGPFPVDPQPLPPIAEYRLRECRWKPATQFTIPDDWLSGVYLGKLSCKDSRFQSYIIFVVRDDRKADIMVQTSDTTWQAYNKWPSEYSMYDSDTPGQPHSTRTWVSYDRPYGKYPNYEIVEQPLSQGSGEYLCWEYPLTFWLEQEGYDVTYCSNIDTHTDREGLRRVKCFLSVGHDEYWSLDMFNNVKQAVDEGLNVAFLGGNCVYGAISLDPSSAPYTGRLDEKTMLTENGTRAPVIPDPKGRSYRIMRRIGRYGGVTDDEKASGMIGPYDFDPPSESTLVGARTVWPFNGSADWICTKPEHWIFEGTGMKKGDRIPALVGWEHHGDPADIPGLEVIAEGTVVTIWDWKSQYTSTVYPGPKGNWVFNAATIFWSIGLSRPPGVRIPYYHYGRPHGTDERVQKIMSNYLKKCQVLPFAKK